MEKINSDETTLKRKMSSEDGSDEEDLNDEIIYYEEESESEPELDCDIWDFDSKISDFKSEKSMIGYHLMPTCNRNPNENPSKRIKVAPEIRNNLLEDDFKIKFKTSWNNNEKFYENKMELIVNPFKVCVINDFLENKEFLDDLRQEFYEVDWNMRNMDLYEFFQSEDLKHLTSCPAINLFYELLQTHIMKWVVELTGFELTHVSATCSYYGNTDYLLVHDDQRSDRMVAFVLYLTGSSGWSESKGGALQLLTKDKTGQPSDVIRDIFPLNNQFVFFPVTSDSYHQVAEVTTLSDCRFSINGWFHTKTPPVFEIPTFQPYPDGLYSDKRLTAIDLDIDLSAWLAEDYLNCNIMGQIREYFEENSEISLNKFLRDECFNEISQILHLSSLSWIKIGPPNRYCYEVIDIQECPQILQRFINLFQSKQMFYLLQQYTELELTKNTASMKFELQKWTPGCYSLLTDCDWEEKKELDVIISFGCKKNCDVIGARTQYVSVDEQVQSALITIEPQENNLNIVYRDTARLTKYFSKQSRCDCFYTLICSYSE